MTQQEAAGFRGDSTGGWCAWRLPADETCARVARHLVKNAVADLGLELGVVEDAVLMTSELAANTLHASEATRAASGGDGPGRVGFPELWLYLREAGSGRELVCKVFDSYRGWLYGPPSVSTPVPSMAGYGRGLQIVHELSGGRWGHHLSRSRLGGSALRGKVVWFAVPVPSARARLADAAGLLSYPARADVIGARGHRRISDGQAARQLESMLRERGFGARDSMVVRADDNPDIRVLPVCRGLSLRFGAGCVSLTGPEGHRDQWSYSDLVEATEHTVRRYEELDPELAGPGLLVTA